MPLMPLSSGTLFSVLLILKKDSYIKKIYLWSDIADIFLILVFVF